MITFFRKVTLFIIFICLFSYKGISEAVARSCSVKKVFLEISQNSWENACARAYFLIKLQANLQLQETLAQTFSCEVCKISKNTPSYRTPPVAASEISRHGATK